MDRKRTGKEAALQGRILKFRKATIHVKACDNGGWDVIVNRPTAPNIVKHASDMKQLYVALDQAAQIRKHTHLDLMHVYNAFTTHLQMRNVSQARPYLDDHDVGSIYPKKVIP
jgi:hypothetical protein